MVLTISLVSNSDYDLKEIILKRQLGEQENFTKTLLIKLDDLISSVYDSGRFQMITPTSIPTLTFLKYEELTDFIWGEELLSYRIEINHSAKRISFHIEPEKVEIDPKRIKAENIDSLKSELEDIRDLNFNLDKIVRDSAVRGSYSYHSPIYYVAKD